MNKIETIVKDALAKEAMVKKSHNTGADKEQRDAEIDRQYQLESFRMSQLHEFESKINHLSTDINMFKQNVLNPLRNKNIRVEQLQDEIMKHVKEMLERAFRGY